MKLTYKNENAGIKISVSDRANRAFDADCEFNCSDTHYLAFLLTDLLKMIGMARGSLLVAQLVESLADTEVMANSSVIDDGEELDAMVEAARKIVGKWDEFDRKYRGNSDGDDE